MDAIMNKRLIGTVSIVFIFLVFLTPISTIEVIANSPEDITESTPATCPVDMISYWNFDETAGKTYDDYYGSNDAVCTTKCPAPTEGFLNGAQLFSGNQEVKVPYNASFDWDADSSFSIVLWVKIENHNTYAQNMVFISRYAGIRAWWLGGGNQAVFSLRDSHDVVKEVYGVTKLNDNIWHQVVAIHDGNKKLIQLYVDGKLEISETVSFTGDWISDKDISIGYHNISPYYYFNGKLDEISIYGKALSSAEIQYLYNKNKLQGDYCVPVSLTVNTDGPGTAQATPVGPYKLGQEVTLTAFPGTDNIFYDWSGDLSCYDNPAKLMMDGDKVVTAKFTAPVSYTLTVETIGQGTVVVNPDLPAYPHRDFVNLSAVPSKGWEFAGWSGNLVGSDNPADLMMTGNFKVIATFDELVSKIFLPLNLKQDTR